MADNLGERQSKLLSNCPPIEVTLSLADTVVRQVEDADALYHDDTLRRRDAEVLPGVGTGSHPVVNQDPVFLRMKNVVRK
jgi:hypothetical protein